MAQRELDHRANEGIDVTLLWNTENNVVSIRVVDEREHISLEYEIAAGDALDAFHHPYVFACTEGDPRDDALAA